MSRTAIQYFEDICAIPHPSRHMERIRKFVIGFAEDHKLKYCDDETGNIIIYKPASAGYEKVKPVMLQGHMDMVAAKTPDKEHDFVNDPLTLIREGDILHADRTTLGSDDGISVAYMLAILDDEELKHPALECVFTVDEEIGLIGANAMTCENLESGYMINLDSPVEGVFTISCAGGRRYDVTLKYEPEIAHGFPVHISLKHLRGGHSGEDAHKGRASANVIMADVLNRLNTSHDIRFVSFNGGSQDNAIPSYADADIVFPASDLNGLESEFEAMKREFTERHSETDPDMEFTMTVSPEADREAASSCDTGRIISMINELPMGIIAMSRAVPGLVQTSVNIGIVESDGSSVHAVAHLRSSEPDDMNDISERVEAAAKKAGAEFYVPSDYPAWKFEEVSPFRDLAVDVYTEMYGEAPKLEIIHAGLECGIIKGRMPELDIISIGPNEYDLHSPTEHMSLSSFDRVYDYIVKLLAIMDNNSGL